MEGLRYTLEQVAALSQSGYGTKTIFKILREYKVFHYASDGTTNLPAQIWKEQELFEVDKVPNPKFASTAAKYPDQLHLLKKIPTHVLKIYVTEKGLIRLETFLLRHRFGDNYKDVLELKEKERIDKEVDVLKKRKKKVTVKSHDRLNF